MSTDLPRPIARADIRVGDRIRAEWTDRDVERTDAGTVDSIDDNILLSADGGYIGWIGGPPDAWTYTLLDRPAPALPTEPGSVVLASRLYGVDYDPPVPLAYSPPAYPGDTATWILLGYEGDGRRWYSPDRIESWTLARIVPADEPEAERRVRPEITDEMVERVADAYLASQVARIGHGASVHLADIRAALEAALGVTS